MISKPDAKVLEAMHILLSDSNFQRVHQYLKDCLDTIDIDNRRTVDDFRVRWRQGGSQALEDLLSFLESAKALRR